MKPCDVIQEVLAAGESLTDEQRTHLEICRECGDMQAAMNLIASTGDSIRALAKPSDGDVAMVQEAVARKTRPSRPLFRLAWASAAMVVGILLAIGILSNTFGPDPVDQSEERLIALLDEVSQIADPDEEETTDSADAEGLYLAEVLLEEDTQVDTELQLPESYQLLEQALDNDWL